MSMGRTQCFMPLAAYPPFSITVMQPLQATECHQLRLAGQCRPCHAGKSDARWCWVPVVLHCAACGMAPFTGTPSFRTLCSIQVAYRSLCRRHIAAGVARDGLTRDGLTWNVNEDWHVGRPTCSVGIDAQSGFERSWAVLCQSCLYMGTAHNCRELLQDYLFHLEHSLIPGRHNLIT